MSHTCFGRGEHTGLDNLGDWKGGVWTEGRQPGPAVPGPFLRMEGAQL